MVTRGDGVRPYNTTKKKEREREEAA